MPEALSAPPWLVSWLQGINVWDALLFLAGVLALVWFVKHKGWRTLKAMANGIINATAVLEAVQGLPEFIKRTDERLGEHTAQLRNSHSTNLRDDVTSAIDAAERTEDLVKGLHGRVDDVQREMKETATIATDNRARIGALELASKKESS